MICDTMWYLSGWWGLPTRLKNDGVKVSWGSYSQYMEKENMFQTTNQLMMMNLILNDGDWWLVMVNHGDSWCD